MIEPQETILREAWDKVTARLRHLAEKSSDKEFGSSERQDLPNSIHFRWRRVLSNTEPTGDMLVVVSARLEMAARAIIGQIKVSTMTTAPKINVPYGRRLSLEIADDCLLMHLNGDGGEVLSGEQFADKIWELRNKATEGFSKPTIRNKGPDRQRSVPRR